MKIRFNVTGARRKALAKAVAEILGEDYRYLGVPTFAYALDYFIIDREGTLICDDRTDEGKIDELVSAKLRIGLVISRVEDPSIQLILEKRYLEFQPLSKIGVKMKFTYRWTRELHHRGLEAVQQILDEEENTSA